MAPTLFAAMQEQAGEVEFNCFDVLKRMGPGALPAVLEEIGRGDAGFTDKALTKRRLFRARLVAIAGEARAPGGADALCRILHEDAWGPVRRKAAFYLGEQRDPRAVPALIAALRDDAAEDVRVSAQGALRKCCGKDLGPNPDVWEQWWKDHPPSP